MRQRVQQLQALMAGAFPLQQQQQQQHHQVNPDASRSAAHTSLPELRGLGMPATAGGLNRDEAEALALGALEATASDEGSGDEDDDELAEFGSAHPWSPQ